MSAVLKSLLVSCVVLSMAAISYADEPAKSVLDGGRPLASASNTAEADTGNCSSCSTGFAADCGCNSGCGSKSCKSGFGLFKCNKNACDTTCNSDCGNSCGKQHGCWLHHGKKSCNNTGCGYSDCGNNGCGACGADCGAGCDSCGSDKHHHGNGHRHGKHAGCGCGCHGDGYHQGRFCTRCNMIPHIAYINPLSSYYYFRPYQSFHVRAHQDEVVTYGGDPRNPYANLLFDNLYAELEATWAEEDAANLGSPFEDEVPQGNSDEADTPDAPPVDPPTPDFNTSHSPASRLRAVQQAKPINQSVVKQKSTASVANEQRRVFRMKK